MHRRLMAIPVTSALAAALLGLSFPAGASAGRTLAGDKKEPVAVGTGGAVASMSLGASEAGIEVLRRGGNAIDAAVATAAAMGVTIPFVAGPGGGGFMVIYLARTHQVMTIDGRENCPSGVYPDDVHRPEDRQAARLLLRLRPAAVHRRAVHGGHLGQGGAAVRPPQPGRRPAARPSGSRTAASG